jgi:tripartite-type tricarboxylate transporter receptor subunit TctC
MSRRYLSAMAFCVMCGLCVAAGGVNAQTGNFPAKPIRMIVPLAPGGGSDIVARVLAQALSEYWGRAVVVDNRPGAGSTVGTALAAKAAPDGYTLLVSSSSLAISPALYPDLEFDVLRDLAGVTLIASQPSMLVVHPSVVAGSVEELVAVAKSRKLAYGSAGIGSATHLGTELFLHTAKARVLHVPYKSAGQATGALLSGEVQMLLTNMASVAPHVASGKLTAIGVSSRKRSAAAPDVRTLQEAGLPGFEYATWYGMLVPAKTEPQRVEYLQRSAARVLAIPAVAERFERQGLETHASRAAEFSRHLRSEIERWAEIVKSAGIRGQ